MSQNFLQHEEKIEPLINQFTKYFKLVNEHEARLKIFAMQAFKHVTWERKMLIVAEFDEIIYGTMHIVIEQNENLSILTHYLPISTFVSISLTFW